MTGKSQLFEPWLNFNHAIVRQLAFVIASPNIIIDKPNELQLVHDFEIHPDEFWQSHYQSYLPRLLELDQDPKELIQFVEKLKSTRLGLRFEYLMWFWLQDQQHTHLTLLEHSVQMIEGKNTLGELDFVVFNHLNNEIEHWEVALKFYLAEQDFSLKNWYGLNRTDTLYRKLNHFTQKQFQFNQTAQHQIKRKYAVMKGQLYFPQDFDPINIPKWVNRARNIGSWGHQILDDFYRLERQEWICRDQLQTSESAKWWTNGLYHNTYIDSYYMFRQLAHHTPCVLIM